ncbi:fructose-bisphosphatase class III [Staphylococcus aureus]
MKKVNDDTNEITVYGNTYPLKDTCFQTVNRDNQVITTEEEEVMNKLLLSFQQSEKLRRHMSFLMRKGSLYFLTI